MRILITGCRHWHDPDMAEVVVARLIARYGPGIVIVHGGCRGIDASFADACEELDIASETYEADWERHGKGAGPLRNKAMLATGIDMVIAFHRDIKASLGTRDCLNQALALAIPVYLCSDETATPVRVKGPM